MIRNSNRVLAAIELGRRTMAPTVSPVQYSSPGDLARYLIPKYGHRPIEVFGIVLLNTRNHIIRCVEISRGSVCASLAEPREIFAAAVTHRASGIVAFHNHPSGDPSPSPDDRRLTTKLAQAGEIMGIPVLDHIILGAGSQFYSFKAQGQIGGGL